eukprot:c4899_g1_i1.p1 GENE.c4899_g1_i1~~c4899_g1_i1.p1  ORF type:complete len:253 (+),score=42.54 c4899_g1_i1:36-794(+)
MFSQAQLAAFFIDPTSSSSASAYSVTLNVVVIISCILVILESIPNQSSTTQGIYSAIETAVVVVFSFDFAASMIFRHNRFRWLISFWGLLDFCSILPFYIAIVTEQSSLSNLRIIRAVRMIRIFRAAKLFNRFPGFEVTTRVMMKSGDVFVMLLVFVGIGLVFFSTIMFMIEAGDWNEEKGYYEICVKDECFRSEFQSIPESMWWCLVTLATVGYGDAVPLTNNGKFVASITMIAGVLVNRSRHLYSPKAFV